MEKQLKEIPLEISGGILNGTKVNLLIGFVRSTLKLFLNKISNNNLGNKFFIDIC